MTPNAHIANMPAFPFGRGEHPGMTYREYLIAQIANMEALYPMTPGEKATRIVEMADLVIAELAKQK